MPQGPLLARDIYDATTAIYGITGVTALRTTGGAKLVEISVITAGTAGGIFDASATGSPATVGRQIGVIPATAGVYLYNWPTQSGLVIGTGTGQTLAVTLA